MAGSPNGNVISVAEAKARLLEAGARKSTPATLAANPAVRAAALLLAGAFLGRMIRGRGKDQRGGALVQMLMRAGMTAAPLLVEQFIRGVSARDRSQERDAPNPHGADS